MKRIELIFVMFLGLSLTACKKEEQFIQEQFIQYIKGCADCVSCDRWSWGSGEGEPFYNEYGSCSFLVLEDGELQMQYILNSTGILQISGGASFYVNYYQDYGWYRDFTTSVKKDTKIIVSGYGCQIKDVKIICDGRTGDDEIEGDDF